MIISASHNPYYDNGIKFFSEHGTKLADSVELEIEAILDQEMEIAPKLGKVRRLSGCSGALYLNFVKVHFPIVWILKD